MGNYGIKIAKDGKDINSTNPDDYIFWSKYQSLTLIDKVESGFNIPTSACVGTVTHTHNLGWFPFCRVFISAGTGVTGLNAGEKYEVPFTTNGGDATFCSVAGNFSNLSFSNLVIGTSTVSFDYSNTCIGLMQPETCAEEDSDYIAEIYYYMFELGS